MLLKLCRLKRTKLKAYFFLISDLAQEITEENETIKNLNFISSKINTFIHFKHKEKPIINQNQQKKMTTATRSPIRFFPST